MKDQNVSRIGAEKNVQIGIMKADEKELSWIFDD